MFMKKYSQAFKQARRQDLAAGGGQKPEGGAHIFKIQYWIYVATGGPNVKWGGTDFKWGGRAPLPPPAGDGPAFKPHPNDQWELGALIWTTRV